MRKQRKTYRTRRKRRNKQRMRALVYGMLLVVGLLVVLFGLAFFYVNKWDKKTIHNHVFIGETDVSGKNKKEAVQMLQEKMEQYHALPVTLKVGEAAAQTTLGELGLSMVHMEELVDQALNYGKQGNVWKRLIQIRQLEKERKLFEDEFSVDKEKVTVFAEEHLLPLEARAQNASIKHTGDGFVITDEVSGSKLDTKKSIRELNAYLNEEWKYNSFEFGMQYEVEEPEIKRQDLESIQDILGSFRTDAGSGERRKNLIRATELINGTLLMPGEVFSVEKKTVPYTTDNGYVEGTAYENGQIIKSIGGGLCQVSTTLYNAVLYAELAIETRSAHSMMVDYVEPSRDAAIAEGVKDLRFRNSYDTPILIEGYVDSANRLRFYIYGKETRPENRKVEYVSETLEKKPCAKKFVASSAMPIGEKKAEGAKLDGAVARLWKVVYENGAEVSRKVMNNSNYRASEQTITIGIASDNSEATELVKKAVESQDETKISEAISKAQELEKEKVDESGEGDTDGV